MVHATVLNDTRFSDTYLQVNDGLNSVLNRYDAFKRGDYTAAVNPIPPELEPSAGGAGSLIDLDDSDALASLGGFGAPAVAPAAAAPAVVPSAPPAAPTPDLFSLLDGTAPAVRSPPQNGFAGAHQQSAASGGMVRMGGSRSGTPGTPMGSIALPSTPRNSMPAMQQPAGGMGMHAGVGMGALAGMQPFAGSGPSMGAAHAQHPAYFGGARQAQPMQPQAPTTAAPAPAPAPAQGKDPFADLAGIF
jgi:ADP-ribosylation factor-binding protein GGA